MTWFLLLGWLLTLTLSDHVTLLSGALDPWFLVFQVVGLIGATGTLVVLHATFRLWHARNLWRGVRWINLLISLACLGFTWFVIRWHLINFNMNY